MRRYMSMPALLLLAGLAGGCAALGSGTLVQPPQFSSVEGQEGELRLLAPGAGRPLGGAQLRLYARVRNPNAFGVTLAALQGNVHLEGARAAQVNFPLGLPLRAATDTIIPLDVSISFSDLPGLADAAQRILTRNRVAYRLDGTVTLDATPFGRPSFGPSTWLQGETQVVR
jgi:hypothetical protein